MIMQNYKNDDSVANFSSKKGKNCSVAGDEFALLERGAAGIKLSPALIRNCGTHDPVSEIWFSPNRPVVELWLGSDGNSSGVSSAEVSEAIDRIAGPDSCMAVIQGPAMVMGRCVSFNYKKFSA